MTPWTIAWRGQNRCYRHKGDQRYQLRWVTEPSGQTRCRVWALYLGDIRIWEVHALGSIGIVRADAGEYIRAARVAG